MAVFGITSALVGVGLNIFGATAAGWAAATAFANVVIGGALLGASILFSAATAQRAPSIKTAQAQAVVNQSTGPRIRGYGKAMLGGTRAFFDSGDGTLFQVIMAHHGEIDAWEYFKVGDKALTPNIDGDITNRAFVWVDDAGDDQYAVRIRSHLGTSSQGVDSMMASVWSGVWTTAHRLRGIAYFAVRFRSPPSDKFQALFPESYNTPVRGLGRLSKVYDPRDVAHDPDDASTWEWSDNASLAILDYITHPDGMRLTKDDCDLDSFAAFADICDEAVSLAAGGTEKRYRLWGVYQLTDEPTAVLNQMRRACDAEFYTTPEGKIAIRGGVWEAPTVTITEDHVLGHSMEQGNNRFSAFNELKIIYTSPDHDFQTMEATAWVDLTDQAERGVIASDLDLDYVPSPTQARRLAKIHISKSNPRWKGRIRCSLAALDAWGERTIRLVLPELQIDEAFYVSAIELSPDLSSMELEVVTINQAAYDWTTAEEGTNPAIPVDTAPDLEFPVPVVDDLYESGGGHIVLVVEDPMREGLTLEAEVRLGAGGNWETMDFIDPLTARYLNPGPGDYQVRARWRGAGETVSAWSFPLSEITIT